ncbi:MAG: DUF3604 domain-containing protein [Burkholderiaceae bacterium]
MTATANSTLSAAAGVRVTYEGPTVLAAGSLARFAIGVEADVDLPPGAELGFARRWPSDWGMPQWRDPSAADFVAIDAGPARQLRWWNARLHAWHPFDHILFVALPDGLGAGERLTLRFGDDREGSPGFTVQTFIEEEAPLSVRLRRSPEAAWTELATLGVRIAGNEPHRLVLTAPSRVAAGQPFELHVRVEDVWGNPSTLGHRVRLGAPLEREVTIPGCGWLCFEATLNAPGFHRLSAQAEGAPAPAALSNPIEVVADATGHLLCWGDLHAQSVIGCGARAIDAYFAHARDFAATDFASHQANCFLVSNPEWSETQAGTARAHRDGSFVTLLGVEWSGATPFGGDHNLYFPGDAAELHRCTHEFVADKSDLATDLAHVTDVHEHYRGSDTLIAVHVGGRTADLRWHEPTLDRLVEVHSTHATSEWFLLEALQRGQKMGVIAGSDGVDGRPGASHPGHMNVRNTRGGLTAVMLPELTRGGLWSALKARRCYATTGERIVLQLEAGSARMGDEISVAHAAAFPPFDVIVEGTAPIETIDFFRDAHCIASVDPMSEATALSNAIRVGWCGASAPGNWQRARMRWDGALRVHGARIVAAQPWAFDTPDEGLCEIGTQQVTWRSITAGDWDGLILELDDPTKAELTFVSEPMTLQVRLGDIASTPRVFEADSPMRRVELRRLPQQMPAMGWRGCFKDPAPPVGSHAYWIRVRQSDGALAWSTPIFVTLAAGAT